MRCSRSLPVRLLASDGLNLRRAALPPRRLRQRVIEAGLRWWTVTPVQSVTFAADEALV